MIKLPQNIKRDTINLFVILLMCLLGAAPIIGYLIFKAVNNNEYDPDEKKLVEDYREWKNKQKHF